MTFVPGCLVQIGSEFEQRASVPPQGDSSAVNELKLVLITAASFSESRMYDFLPLYLLVSLFTFFA